jgi:hypothetical protein
MFINTTSKSIYDFVNIEIFRLQNKSIPSYLTGDGSLTDNFSIEFYRNGTIQT